MNNIKEKKRMMSCLNKIIDHLSLEKNASMLHVLLLQLLPWPGGKVDIQISLDYDLKIIKEELTETEAKPTSIDLCNIFIWNTYDRFFGIHS